MTTPPSPEPVEFVLHSFSSSITMGERTIVDDVIPGAVDLSAVAVFYMAQEDIQNVFQVYTDSDEITDISYEGMHYHVFMDNWPATLRLNPMNAMMDRPESANALFMGNTPSEMLVKHDFIRYLALKLFNTPMATDLFSNESELLNHLNSLGELVYQDISASLWKYATTSSRPVPPDVTSGFVINDVTGLKATTNDLATLDNLGFVLTNKLLETLPNRFNNLQLDSRNLFRLPILAGDTINFTFSINPCPGQNELTGVPPFTGRTYRIKIVIDNGSRINTIPTD
jgi:hypothetical protein